LKIFETSKFKRLRKKLKEEAERKALKEVVLKIKEESLSGKKLKGEFKGLRSFRYFVKGQERRLIYKYDEGSLYILSFGPREGIYE